MRKIYFKRLNEPTQDYDAVGLWGIAPLITVIVFGTILGFLLLLIERVYHNSRLHINSSTSILPTRNSNKISY